jgi:hypothetical protein
LSRAILQKAGRPVPTNFRLPYIKQANIARKFALCNFYLEHQESKVEIRELTAQHYTDQVDCLLKLDFLCKNEDFNIREQNATDNRLLFCYPKSLPVPSFFTTRHF